MARTLFTDMTLQGKTASSCPVLTTTFAKKEIVQTSWTVIVPNMIRVGFCTGLFVPSEIKTEIFSALMAEFIKVLIQGRATDLAVASLHTFLKIVFEDSRVRGFKCL
jgi:hypothetical protein